MGIGSRYCALFLFGLGLLHGALPASSQAETLQWTRRYSGRYGEYTEGAGVAVAADGSVYVVGSMHANGSKVLLRKYSPTGNLRWMRQYNRGISSGDMGRGVAVADDGSIYVTGTTSVWPEMDDRLLLQKYSPNGNTLWTRTYAGGSTPLVTYGEGVAVARNGNVYVVGHGYVEGGQPSDLLLLAYSETGELLWTRSYNGRADLWDYGLGVTVARDGSIYVAGDTRVGGQASNVLLRKYSRRGDPLWTRTYNGEQSSYDAGRGVAVAPDGSVYVSGSTTTQDRDHDLWLGKYSAMGQRLWTKTYEGTGKRYDAGRGAAVGADGSVYVTGYTARQDGILSLLLRKYSAAGQAVFMATLGGETDRYAIGQAVAVAPDGSVYVAGSTGTVGQSSSLLLQKYK